MKVISISPHDKKPEEDTCELTAVASSSAFGPHLEVLALDGCKVLLCPDKEEIYSILIWAQQVLKRNV